MYVKTKKWSTDKFKISKGVFEGDTLSPLILLISFNPIIQLAQSLNACGFCLRMPSSSPETPKINSYMYIYALWDESNSDEPTGWYLAKVISIEGDGSICQKYRKGNLTKVIKQTALKWQPARGSDKWFQSTNNTISISSASYSKPHKVKGLLMILLLSHHPLVITQNL